MIRIILFILLIAGVIFVAYRFGLLTNLQLHLPAGQVTNIPIPTLSIPAIPNESSGSSQPKEATSAARIIFLETPLEASASQKFTIKWSVDDDKIATTSHTAVHYGKIPKPSPKLSSDYPLKSAILGGTIPATFSAQLAITEPGLYFYRANVILNNETIWSIEKTIQINK